MFYWTLLASAIWYWWKGYCIHRNNNQFDNSIHALPNTINNITKLICVCWLLGLNPGVWGEHLTSQFSWVAVWLLVTGVCHVYLIEELIVSPCVLCPHKIVLMHNGGSVDVSFLHGDFGYSSVGSYCYSREWFWNSKTEICCMAPGKWNTSRVSLQEFNIRYIVF